MPWGHAMACPYNVVFHHHLGTGIIHSLHSLFASLLNNHGSGRKWLFDGMGVNNQSYPAKKYPVTGYTLMVTKQECF